MKWFCEQPENNDDDELRLRKVEQQLHAQTVRQLLPLKSSMTHAERGLLNDLDFRLCVMGEMPIAQHVQQLKNLAWKYRRQMVAGTAPKLPPHDPIVMEMEQKR